MKDVNKTLYRIIEALTVSKCPSCGKITRYSGTLCKECLEKYRAEKARPCPFCKMPSDVCVCSTRDLYYCAPLHSTMKSLVFYDSENEVFSNLLKNLKYSSDRGSEKFFARELACEFLKCASSSGEFPEEWCVTFPPRRRNAVRDYGFDQSRGMAKRLASYTGMTFSEMFSRRGKAAQKALDSEGRRKNANSSFSLKKGAVTAGKKFVIVDDVVTSGATMRACQTLLLGSGAKAAYVLSVSKTPMRGAGFDAKKRFRRRKEKTWFNE